MATKQCNRCKLVKNLNDYYKRKMRRTKINLTTSISNTFANRRKCKIIFSMIGTDMEIFRKWTEYQLPEDDYGTKFVFDHAASLSSFNLLDESELLKSMHWSNIRPCTRFVNSEKNDSIDHHLIVMQELKSSFFLKYLSS